MPDPTTPDVIEVDDTYPDTAALDAWIEAHPRGPDNRDHPRINLWMPREAPSSYLDVVNRGTMRDPDERLPNGLDHATVHLYLGGTISVGGYLHELEAYTAALAECVAVARWQATQLAAKDAEDQTS